MSKYVKDLIAKELVNRLEGVDEALLVNVVGVGANETVAMRRQFREKNISLMSVKNSLARRATKGTPLEIAFAGLDGTLAIAWGAEDFVSLVKEIDKLDKDDGDYEAFKTRGGVMDGEQLTPERVKEISKWPSRDEQLSILVGQILAPGANLLSQINSPGGALASQIEQKSKDE